MLDIAGLRLHVTSPLDDEALALLLEAAYQAIDARIGTGESVTEVITPGPGPLLMLSRSAESVSSVTECDIALAADDYELIGSQMLRRLRTGTHPSWAWRGRVIVAYPTPNDDAERDRVAIALVSLDSTHSPGVTSEQLGDWQETYANNSAMNYQVEREAILASYGSPVLMV